MEKFGIYFDATSNEKWGIDCDFYDIYISIGDFAFPGKGWTDLAKYCIDNWTQGFIALLSKSETSIVGDFYDGSYHFNLSQKDEKTLRIELVDEDNDNKIVKESEISINQSILSVLEAIDSVIEMTKEKTPDKTEYWEKMKIKLASFAS